MIATRLRTWLQKLGDVRLAIGIIIVLMGATVASSLPIYYGDGDDLGIAVMLIKRYHNVDYFWQRVYEEKSPTYNGIIKRSLRSIHQSYPRIENIIPPISTIMTGWYKTTYAPIQPALIAILLLAGDNLPAVVVSRLPSFIFYVLGLIIWGKVFAMLFRKAHPTYAILGVCLLACSLENIGFAQGAMPYACVIPALGWLTYLLIKWQSILPQSEKSRMMLVACSGILIYLQFQMIFVGAAVGICLFVMIWVSQYKKHRLMQACLVSIARIWKSGALFAIISFPAIIYIYYKLDHDPHNSWHEGLNGEFLFANWQGLTAIPEFFIHNLYIVVTRLTGFIPEDNALSIVMFITVFALFCVGFLVWIKRLFSVTDAVSIFCVSLGIVQITLLLTSQLTFSPSRHSLLFLPFIVLCVLSGAHWIIIAMTRYLTVDGNRSPSVVNHLLSVLVLASCLYHYDSYLAPRKELFDPHAINMLLEERGVNKVFTLLSTPQMEMMQLNQARLYYVKASYDDEEWEKTVRGRHEPIAWIYRTPKHIRRQEKHDAQMENVEHLLAQYNWQIVYVKSLAYASR